MVERKLYIIGGKLHIIGGRRGRSRATDQTLSPEALLIFKPLFTICQMYIGTVQNKTNQSKNLQIYGLKMGRGKTIPQLAQSKLTLTPSHSVVCGYYSPFLKVPHCWNHFPKCLKSGNPRPLSLPFIKLIVTQSALSEPRC